MEAEQREEGRKKRREIRKESGKEKERKKEKEREEVRKERLERRGFLRGPGVVFARCLDRLAGCDTDVSRILLNSETFRPGEPVFSLADS